jgi:photosystem II stability/assembly factor-like uncharacterized protein
VLQGRRGAIALIALISALPFAAAQPYPQSTFQELHWRMIGPFRGGRTRAVAGVPSQPNVFYIGAVNGGVWKSTDYGRTWDPIFDSQPTQSIGAIAVAPSDPNIVYVASGEGLHRPDLSVGNGIYRSSDAGKTWTHLGLQDGQQIPALVVHPRDPNRLMAAVLGNPYAPSAERGIYSSTDGGKTWERVLGKDENTGGADVQLDPTNPDVVYASLWEAREGPWEDNNLYNGTAGGLFKSTDGGTTWRKLTEGVPPNLTQAHIAVCPSEPKRLYGVFATTDKGSYGSGAGLGVFRSDDSGEHWYRITEDPRAGFRIGGGDLAVPVVDPKNADVIYTASIVTMRSTDGGKTWVSFRGAPGGDDYQNLWINPTNPDIILLVADQGAIVTVNRGQTWGSWYNQPTAQLYHIGVTPTFPYRVCSGQQESGSVCIASRGNDGEITFRDWHPVGTIEYGYTAPDPLDPEIIYGAGRSEVSKHYVSTGQIQNITPIPVRTGKYRANRTQPFTFAPLNPHVLYYTTNVLFRTIDGGETWKTISPDLTREKPDMPPNVGKLYNPGIEKQRGVIYALAPSFVKEGTIWAGTDDGLLWITRDEGKNWTNVTPPELSSWSKVTQISASHFDDDTAYASVSRFRAGELKPYIYRTHDGGKSWMLITAGLPDGPADTVREDPVRKGMLFAGTENTVWVSFDDGDHWQSLQLNLPHTSMRDLWIHGSDLIVATHGRGFWILDDITPLRQIDTATATTGLQLFKPAPAYRVMRSTYPDTPIPPDEPTAENPPDGAIIDYSLAKSAGDVVLEVLDSKGKVARRYSSADSAPVSQSDLEKQLIPLYWLQPFKTLLNSSGMHRWVWDLHYAAPEALNYGYPISAVPHRTPRMPEGVPALPGEYKVRLTAAGQTLEAPLVVKIDPRVKASAAALQQQFDLATRLSTALTTSTRAVREARSAREQLKALEGKASGALAESVKALSARVSTVLDQPETAGAAHQADSTLAGVNGHVAGLYEAVVQADAAPTQAQNHAATVAEEELADAMQRWDALKNSGIPELNAQLKSAGLAEVHPSAQAKSGAGEEED